MEKIFKMIIINILVIYEILEINGKKGINILINSDMLKLIFYLNINWVMEFVWQHDGNGIN